MQRKLVPCHIIVLTLLLLALLPGPSGAGQRAAPELQGQITFEETIPQPEMVRSQYCNNPATNKGVEFLNHGGRIFTPSVTTASPTHALTNQFSGDEFGEFKTVQIRFTTGQSAVSVQAGLNRAYSFGVVAHMWAYSTDTPGSGTPVALDNIQLGVGPTEVLHELSVTSASANIRSVEIWFSGPAAGNATHEVIDDLTYSTIGPPCITDTAAPSVQITKPAADGTTQQTSYQELAFKASDSQTGIAKIQVLFLSGSGQELGSFYVCGGTGPLCLYDVVPTQASYDFYTVMPNDTAKVRVKAWDFADHVGQADRTINVVAIGYFNLWVQAMEITQATQPWLPTNAQPTLAGPTPPSHQYPAAPTSVPLVANRTTVVRLYAGVAGTTGNQQVDKVRAQLRCFSDAAYTTPCAGSQVIDAQNQPPNILKEITVRPADSLDTKRRDTRLSWNFVLPSSWTGTGTIHLEAVLQAPTGLQECAGCVDAANRFRIWDVQFHTVPALTSLVHLVSVQRKLGNQTFNATQYALDSASDLISRHYPIDEATVFTAASATWTYDDCGDTCDPDPQKNLGARCNSAFNDLKNDYPNKANKQAVYGLMDTGFPCAGLGGGGYSYGANPSALGHEVGHAMGLLHAGPPPGHGVCNAECQNNWCDTDWPNNHGTTGAFGFDIIAMKVIPGGQTQCLTAGVCDNGVNEDNDTVGGCAIPDDDCAGQPDTDPPADFTDHPHDIMSYGPCSEWISPRNWIRIYNAFTGSNLPYPKSTTIWAVEPAVAGDGGTDEQIAEKAALPAPQLVPGQRGSYLLLRGQELSEGEWSLPPAYEMELPSGTSDHEGQGEHSVALLGRTGQELLVRRFEVPLLHADLSEPPDALAVPLSFGELLPLPEGVVTVQFRRGDEVLAERQRSEQHPSVQIISPTADGFQGQPDEPLIIWSGEDGDGDPLHTMIQYSPAPGPDGEREWQTLASDWTEQVFPVDLGGLPGGEEAMVRVLASDGFNTAVATSPVFAVQRKPPVARILSPATETVMEEGDRLVLVGTASDLEDGLLDPEALHWFAGRYMPLGTGRHLDVDILPPGQYRVSLMAEDGQGMVGLDSISVTVLDRPNSQPTANAGPDRTAGLNATVRLDGNSSEDPDGDPLAFAWSVAVQPPGSQVSLAGADTPFPTFSANTEGDYEIELLVHDGQVGSLPDRVTVQVGGPAQPRLFVAPVESTLPVSATATVELRVDNIENLYAAQVELVFNPEVVQVVDAYDFQPGVQIEEGDFPVPDTVIRNQADNTQGTIHYAVSLQGDKPGVSGSGTLARITFHGLRPGESPLAFTGLVLSDPRSVPIEAAPEGGVLLVREATTTLIGRVILERRASNAGAVVCVDERCSPASPDGSFIIPGLEPGPHTVAVGRESYLRSWREVHLPEGVLLLPEVTLLGGDVNGDDHIEQFDAISTGLAWDTTPMDPEWDRRADITDDSTVNILDMVAVQFNWDHVAPGPWGEAVAVRRLAQLSRPLTQPDLVTRVVIHPSQANLSVTGQTVDLDIRVEQVTDLYGGRVQLSFDPSVLQVRDADPRASAPGVQIRPGDFLDPFNQFVLVNQADNTAGTIDFAVTQLHPATARSGSGVLATVTFEALAKGSSAVHFVDVRLGDDTRPDPVEIPAQTQDALVTVGGELRVYLPVVLRSR